MRALAFVTTAAVTASMLVASPAHAASVRYASPSGTGTTCSQAMPCSFKTAVESASNGDTVQLTADEYPLTEQVQILADDLTIRGPAGIITPGDFLAFLIFKEQAEGGVPDTSAKLLFYGQNTRIERLAITGRADGSGTLVGSGAGATGMRYDRLYVSNSGTGTALFGRNATLTNSFVTQTGPGSSGRAVILTGTIIGSTIYSRTGRGLWLTNSYLFMPNCSVTIRNTLVWGGDKNILVDDTGLGPDRCSTINVDYDYSWIPSTGIQTVGTSTPTAGSHNLADTPAVFDPTDPADSYLSDLVLPPDSPAINAGCTSSCSDHDYYGRPRPVGSANDIGAREQSVRPGSTAVSAASATMTDAVLSATLTPGGSPTTYAVQVRQAGIGDWANVGVGTATTDIFGATPVSVRATGLAAATDYEARLIASNDRGTYTSPASAFRTSSTPSPTVSVTRLRAKVTKRRGHFTSAVTVSAPGTISQSATTGSGARKKTRCMIGRYVSTAGTYAMKCHFDGTTRAKLRRKSLKFTVVTRLTTSTATVSATSRITIPRRR